MAESAQSMEAEEFDILDIPDEEIDKYLAEMEAAEASNSQEITEEESESEEEIEDSEENQEDTEEENIEEEEETPKKVAKSTEKEPIGEVQDLDDQEAALEAEKTDVDYKTEYQKLLAPFKANGKDMQVETVEDARTLMQMGANYNKKMAALKPNLRLVKMLEKNDLLDEEKLSFLIDLSKQDSSAINKLIKDSGVDPLDLDTEKADSYKPNTYSVNDKEVELDNILDEIRDTPSFNTTANIISTKWDEASKQVLVDNPALIKIINDHVDTGIYDKISAVVERERVLGRLIGLSDIEAYKYVGDAINAQGGFQQESQPDSTSNKTTNVNKATNVDPSLNKRRKAASSTKSTKTSTKVDDNFNPLAMSDEEFERIASSKFI